MIIILGMRLAKSQHQINLDQRKSITCGEEDEVEVVYQESAQKNLFW